MTENISNQDYVIPSVEYKGFKPIWLLLIVPLVCAAFNAAGDREIVSALNGIIYGFFASLIPFAIVCLVIGGKLSKKQRDIWAAHDYEWYRKTFPEHALEKGRVSCRHCHGHSVHAKNLMNRSYTRAHVCNQCGKSLYFSPEVPR